MYKKGAKVIYPVYGAGRITQIYDEKIGTITEKYYQIEFHDSMISVAVPVRSSQSLGLREPLSPNNLRKMLRELKRQVRITPKLIDQLDEMSKSKLNSGKIEDAIQLTKILNAIKKRKEKNRKNLSATEHELLELSKKFIVEEVRMVLGKKACDKLIQNL